jgi:hypothetical protein
MKSMLKVIAVLSMVAFAPAMAAQPLQQEKFFFGAGGSINDISGSDEGFGVQVFGGYAFGEISSGILLDAEVGYMTTGDMEVHGNDVEADGIWGAGVIRVPLSADVELLARAGIDFGDDDGVLFGGGIGFQLNKQTTVRAELVERDDVSSMQLNVVFRQ